MVAHETVGMDLEAALDASFGEGFQKVMVVHIALINILLAVTPAHDVVDGTRVLDSQLSRH